MQDAREILTVACRGPLSDRSAFSLPLKAVCGSRYRFQGKAEEADGFRRPSARSPKPRKALATQRACHELERGQRSGRAEIWRQGGPRRRLPAFARHAGVTTVETPRVLSSSNDHAKKQTRPNSWRMKPADFLSLVQQTCRLARPNQFTTIKRRGRIDLVEGRRPKKTAPFPSPTRVHAALSKSSSTGWPPTRNVDFLASAPAPASPFPSPEQPGRPHPEVGRGDSKRVAVPANAVGCQGRAACRQAALA